MIQKFKFKCYSLICLRFFAVHSQFCFSFVSISFDFHLIFFSFLSQFCLICVPVASSNFYLMQVIRNPAKKKSRRGKKHVSHVTNGSRKLVAFFHSPARHYTTATHHSIAWKEAIYQTREILVHSQQQKFYVHRGSRKRNLFIRSGIMLIQSTFVFLSQCLKMPST